MVDNQEAATSCERKQLMMSRGSSKDMFYKSDLSLSFLACLLPPPHLLHVQQRAAHAEESNKNKM